MIVHDTKSQKEYCSGCMACAKECPTSCINHIIDDEGFMYPKVDISMCINCDHCVKMCPFTHPDEYKHEPISCFGAWSRDDSIRFSSATAGIFMVLAKKFINDGGIVYGAAFDDKLNLTHLRADNLKDLKRLQGSKYLQSDFSKIYHQVQSDLDNGLQVLVSGTPCQIAGIRAALNCENLLLIDILCLGVPSPGVFKKYIESIEKNNNKKVKNINFRDKTTGWRRYSQTITFEDGTNISCTNDKSPYMRGFLDKIYIRPSCAKCPFSDSRRVGDITIGDYWGVEKSYPELDNEKGVSLVYVNSQKGFSMLDENKDIEKTEVELKNTLQQALIKPAELNIKRADFFVDYKKDDFDKLSKKYMKQRSRIIQFAVNMLKY